MDLEHAQKSARRFHKVALVLGSHAMGLDVDKVVRERISLPIVVQERGTIYVLNLGTERKDDDFITPYVVNGAFSLELHLKLLSFRITDAWPRIHGLADLFRALPNDVQSEIDQSIKSSREESAFLREAIEVLKTKNVDLQWDAASLLARSNAAYVSWRYAFEESPGCFAGYSELQSALNDAIEKRSKLPK